MKDDAQYILKTYARQPIELVRGEGVYVFDAHGKRYIDFHSGIAVNSLGHSHPEWARVIAEQSQVLAHVSNLFYTAPQTHLAKSLIELSSHRFDKVFFCNSGTEANEAALKFVRKYQLVQQCKRQGKELPKEGENTDRPHSKLKIITFAGGFHGRTMGALSLTAKWAYRAPFTPMLSDVVTLPYNDVAALEAAMDGNVAAVFVEPVQGEGGVHPAKPEFLRAIRELTKKQDALMVVDEVQCGLSRSGAVFAHQHDFFNPFGSDPIQPDLMTLAKPLAGGLPIGAVLLKQHVADCLLPGDHGSTFSGGALICSAAKVIVAELGKQQTRENVSARSNQLMDGLRKVKKELEGGKSPLKIVDVRGLGLLVGMELSHPVKDVIAAANKRGLMLISAGDNVIRMCPPLILTAEHVDEAVKVIREAVVEVAEAAGTAVAQKAA